MSAKRRVIEALLAVYPSAWRREYGPELGDLLLTRPLAGRVISDVLWNGLRQRIEGVVMTAAQTSPRSFPRYLWRRKLWVVAAGGVGALAALAASRWVPDQYRSDAVIVVVPPKVPESLVPTLFPQTFQDGFPALQQEVLSRSRLERIITDLQLYEAERRTGIMQDVVERMRASVEVTLVRSDTIRVGFVGPDPQTVQRVAERLCALLMDESHRDRQLFVENTDQFLESQLETLAGRLVAQERRLALAQSRKDPDLTVISMEYEMLQNQYRSLFTKRQEVSLALLLQRREIGQTFKLLDTARLPTRPFSPNRPRITSIGALAGLGLGLVLVFVVYIRRMSLGGLAPDPFEEPAAG